jgi:hypothetical protein
MSVALAEIGHNNPPEPTPFEAHKLNIETLWVEANNWADGVVVENQAQADKVSQLIEDFRLAHDAADASRIEENTPFDQGKAAVQAKYAPLIADTKAVTGKTVKAIAALKASLKPFLDKLEADKRAAAAKAQAEADAAAEAAAAAVKAAAGNDLAAQDAAEELVETARLASTAASRASNDRAQARGGSRAMGLTKTHTPEMMAPGEALRHYAVERNEELKTFLLDLAKADVREGKRQIPGFKIVEGTRL